MSISQMASCKPPAGHDLNAMSPDALTTYDGRTRLFRFAASRGFESDAIAAAIRWLMV